MMHSFFLLQFDLIFKWILKKNFWNIILWIFFFKLKEKIFWQTKLFLILTWKQVRSLILSWSKTVNSMMKFHLHNCRWLNTKRIGPCLISPVLVYYRDINPLLSGIWRGNVNQIVAWNYASKWIMIVPESYLNFLCRSFHKNLTT